MLCNSPPSHRVWAEFENQIGIKGEVSRITMQMQKNLFFVLVFTILISSCSTTPLDMTLSSIPDVKRQSVELKSITVGYEATTRGVKLETNHLVIHRAQFVGKHNNWRS